MRKEKEEVGRKGEKDILHALDLLLKGLQQQRLGQAKDGGPELKWVLHMVTRTWHLSCHLLLLGVHTGKKQGWKQRQSLKITGRQMWNAGVPDSGLACSATVVTPDIP